MVRKHARPCENCLTLLSDIHIMVCLHSTLYVSNSDTVSSGTCKITFRISPCRLMRLLCAALVATVCLQYFIVHKIRPLSPVLLSLQLHVVQHFNVCLKNVHFMSSGMEVIYKQLCRAGFSTYEGWNFNSGNYLFTTDTKKDICFEVLLSFSVVTSIVYNPLPAMWKS